MRPLELVSALETLYHARIPGFVEGSPGVGKSDIFRQLCDKLGIRLIDVRLSQFDSVDLRGALYIENNRTAWAIPHFLPTDPDSKGIILFDEFNSAPIDVQPPAYQIFLDRQLGDWKMPDGWVAMAAGNLLSDRAITNKTSTAFNNRVVFLALEPHLDDWCRWAVANDIPPALIAFVRFRPNLLFTFDPKSSEKPFGSPRSWGRQVADIMRKQPASAVEMALYSGAVGSGNAGELVGFLQIWRQLPSLDGILLNPDTAPVSDDPSVGYAVACGLARKATVKNFRQIVTYVTRMQPEWMVACVKDATRRDPGLEQTEAFGRWASLHADALA
jgi:hypothetical protein